jgi:hypothetical protein
MSGRGRLALPVEGAEGAEGPKSFNVNITHEDSFQ